MVGEKSIVVEKDLKSEVNSVISQKVRPYLKDHHGDISVVSVVNGCVKIKLYGACSGCPMADTATRDQIKQVLSSHFDEIKEVEIDREISSELIDMAKSILKA